MLSPQWRMTVRLSSAENDREPSSAAYDRAVTSVEDALREGGTISPYAPERRMIVRTEGLILLALLAEDDREYRGSDPLRALSGGYLEEGYDLRLST